MSQILVRHKVLSHVRKPRHLRFFLAERAILALDASKLLAHDLSVGLLLSQGDESVSSLDWGRAIAPSVLVRSEAPITSRAITTRLDPGDEESLVLLLLHDRVDVKD